MKLCDVVLNSVWFDPRVTKQVSEYQKAGIEVSCVGMKCKRYRADKVSEMPCKTVLVERDAHYGGKQKSILKKVLRECYRIRAVRNAIIEEQPDVIHANDLDALIPSYLAKKKLGCRLVYDAHEINCENRIYAKYLLYNIAMKCIERFLVRRCDRMICVSHAAAAYFAKQYRIALPMVITNCITTQAANPEPREKHTGFEVLNHGVLHDSRGLEFMAASCNALKQYPEIRMAARGYGGMEEKLRQQIEEEKLENFILYPPVLPQELIPEAGRSHVGVAVTLPVCLNFKLSVSNRLFEYAAAGLPVILSDIPEHRMLNEQYQFGIIVENNTQEAFEAAVLSLYQDSERYNRLCENALKMSKEITWERQFAPLVDFLKELCGSEENVGK